MSLAMTVHALVAVSYFLITRGIIYDVIVEPPSTGSMTDGQSETSSFLGLQGLPDGLASLRRSRWILDLLLLVKF